MKYLYAIAIVAVLVCISNFISASNRLKKYLVKIDESKRNLDIALAKRYDTISEMIKVAKSFAKHETDAFTNIVKLRQEGAILSSNDAIKNQNDAIKEIFALAEAYPELKSSAEFLRLQDEIDDENEKLAAAKRIVNGNISILNQEIVSFPTSIVAKANSIKKMEFLTEEDLDRKKSMENFDYNV
ncbi:LemA family protein [Peptoniphilus duerdenii]|uniref:LemA family protein n=1 Tax=Peptoniphilus duerdenii TaxID=507750 RepID=UPI0023F13B11|nr:LemA family protein [Peptoniphilus duerdenii]